MCDFFDENKRMLCKLNSYWTSSRDKLPWTLEFVITIKNKTLLKAKKNSKGQLCVSFNSKVTNAYHPVSFFRNHTKLHNNELKPATSLIYFFQVFSIVSVVLIMLSVSASCAITLPQFSESPPRSKNVVFKTIDYLCGIWFTIELLLRIIFCPRRRLFFRQVTNWIDILSVLPFYLQLFDPQLSINLIQALLMIRLLRLFRFFRLLYGLQILLHTLKASSYELGLLLLILLIPVVLFSSIIYYIEQTMHGEQSKFRSIPVSLWWSLITMTTVGYGDMVPQTWAGKIIGGACSICGILVVALPISIIGGNFNLYYAHAQARLKLPKRRNRLLLSSITSDFSDRRSSSGTRRRGLRMRSNVPFETWDEENEVQRSRNGSKQRNSVPKKNSSDTSRNSRTWSIPSSKSDHAFGNNNDVKLSPTSTRGNIERRYSRNERVSPKLSDLPEKDETEEIETSGSHLQNAKRHSRVKSYSPSERLPLWLAESTRVPRMRSSSVPSNAQRPPRNGPPPRKTKSQSSPICRRCSLPKAIPNAYETERSQYSSPEVCCCLGKREISRESPNSTYTIYIPGVDEGVQVSMESLPSWNRELSFDYRSPIQPDFVPNLSKLSDEDSDSANDLQDQDEHDTITSEVNNQSNSESKPLLTIDMPISCASMTDQETSIWSTEIYWADNKTSVGFWNPLYYGKIVYDRGSGTRWKIVSFT